jgi:dihydrofolate reductase
VGLKNGYKTRRPVFKISFVISNFSFLIPYFLFCISYFISIMISIIVAAAQNNAIGKDNRLLWHLPNDMKFFKNTTWGMPVIMGRKTFEALHKPLPGRFNIVITGQPGWHAEGVTVAPGLEDAIKTAKEKNYREIFIIGGGEIYRQSMEITDRIYMTRVQATPEADVFFPEMEDGKWQLVSHEDFAADEKHAYAYSFQTWERKN